MIWLTWRQQRLETLIAIGLLALVAAYLLKTGLDIASAYQRLDVAACLARDSSPGGCRDVTLAFGIRTASAAKAIVWLNFVPLLIGVLVAAPFVLDLEHGTYRLGWTQSVTHGRWLAVRLGLILGGAFLAAVALTLVMTWWNAPQDHLASRLNPNQFEFEGIVPTAYTLFAAAICLATGSLLRRAIPAIGITLVAYVALRATIGGFLRYRFLAPVTKHVSFNSGGPGGPDVPSRADYLVNATASVPKEVMRACFGGFLNPPPVGSPAGQHAQACISAHGVLASVIYQPGSRFWVLQGIEASIYLVPAFALLGVAVWWIRYRIS